MAPMLKTLSAAVLCAAVSLPAAAAWQGSAGLGVTYMETGYRDADNQVMPFPAINIESDHFYLSGFEAGTFLMKTDHQRITLGLSYMPLHFDPDDSDDTRMKKLDKRDGSLFANLGYSIRGDWGVLSASVAADVMGESEGFMSDVNYMKRFAIGQWGVTPQVGLTLTNDKFNEYYFGVSRAEENRGSFKAYSPDCDISPYLRVMADWQFADRWTFFAETSVRFHGDEVKDSPMMDKDTMTSIGCGISYNF